MGRLTKRLGVAVAVLLVAGSACAIQAARATADGSGPALTPPAAGLDSAPPMGWNGYNHYADDVTAAIVEAEAQALVSSGMKADGYDYVNLDGGWDLLQRNADGQLQPNPSLFPQGIKPVADYVHSLGLKFGIYTSIGTENCAGTSAGSYGHYAQDARTFASWGVDYVKVDWCDVPASDYPGMTDEQVAQLLGTQMHDAIATAGRPMVFDYNVNNECPDSCSDWTWASNVANLWRISPDIADNFAAMVRNFTDTEELSGYSHPGGWNDPDMLEVGNGGMTTTEDQAEFSLWAEMDAPLIAGNDLTTMSADTKAILTNKAVIAVDQDPLGRQGYAVASRDGYWVLTKPLADGDRAVVLFNDSDSAAAITTSAFGVGMSPARSYTLRDLWTGQVTRTTGEISATVPADGVVMYQVASQR